MEYVSNLLGLLHMREERRRVKALVRNAPTWCKGINEKCAIPETLFVVCACGESEGAAFCFRREKHRHTHTDPTRQNIAKCLLSAMTAQKTENHNDNFFAERYDSLTQYY